MRYIPYKPSKLVFPAGWAEKAARARAELEAANPSERAEIISRYQDLWKALKPQLAALSNSKCWYTEAKQCGTDTDVDHFRPKGSVKGVHRADTGESHEGYWWLAFEPDNYRFSCIVANRPRRDLETGHVGGKADEFPIEDESKRAWNADDDYSDELPVLLDPCDPVDVKMVTFGENGEALPRHSKAEMSRMFKKAERSIVLYHLNHSDFVKARMDLRDNIKALIRQAQKLYKRLNDADPTIELSYKTTIRLLRDACSADAPFSSFAMSMVDPYKMDESLLGVFD